MPYSLGRTMETEIFTPCIHGLVGTALLSRAENVEHMRELYEKTKAIILLIIT